MTPTHSSPGRGPRPATALAARLALTSIVAFCPLGLPRASGPARAAAQEKPAGGAAGEQTGGVQPGGLFNPDEGAGAGKANRRLAVPEPAALADAEKLIKQVYARQYADRSPAGRRALAAALARAAATEKDPAARFVLWREARDNAATAGDLAASFAVVDVMARVYSVNAVAMKLAAAEVAARAPGAATGTAAGAEGLATACLGVCADAQDAGDYVTALKAASLAESAARGARDEGLSEEARKRVERARAAEQASVAASAAEAKLKTNPNDPAACLTLGRFLCFVRGQWDKGLPLLANGSDPPLKELAGREVSAIRTANGYANLSAQAQVSLGDAWWDASEKSGRAAAERAAIRERAAYWYRLAVPALTGLARIRVNQRLAALQPAELARPHVKVLSAKWGDGSGDADVTAVVQQELDADPWIGVAAENALVSRDPAPFRHKSLRLRYAVHGAVSELELGEGDAAVVPPVPADGIPLPRGTSPGFRIVAARYGSAAKWLDVTDKVRKKVRDPSREFTFDNGDAGADPTPQYIKHLIVWFDDRDRRYVALAHESNRCRCTLKPR